MDPTCRIILDKIGILPPNIDPIKGVDPLEGLEIPRDVLLNHDLYLSIHEYIPKLKDTFSSSVMTSLQNNAEEMQKWPLLNLVRQILSLHKLKMVPLRKCDGYTETKVKRFKRFFVLEKIKGKEKEKEKKKEEEKEEKKEEKKEKDM